jgi:hypothetical protein
MAAASVPPAVVERVVETLTHHFAHDELTEADLEARRQGSGGRPGPETRRAWCASRGVSKDLGR